jgi:hypothetical protein
MRLIDLDRVGVISASVRGDRLGRLRGAMVAQP